MVLSVRGDVDADPSAFRASSRSQHQPRSGSSVLTITISNTPSSVLRSPDEHPLNEQPPSAFTFAIPGYGYTFPLNPVPRECSCRSSPIDLVTDPCLPSLASYFQWLISSPRLDNDEWWMKSRPTILPQVVSNVLHLVVGLVKSLASAHE